MENQYLTEVLSLNTNADSAFFSVPHVEAAESESDNDHDNDHYHKNHHAKQGKRLTMKQLMQMKIPITSSQKCHHHHYYDTPRQPKLRPSPGRDQATFERPHTTRIPKIIHQADLFGTCQEDHDKDGRKNKNKNKEEPSSKSSKSLWNNNVTAQWSNITDFDYYFHTRPRMEAFLYQDWPEFPHLSSIAQNCIPQYQGFGDLWRALLLWEFGGGVVDYDWVPKSSDSNNDNNNDTDYYYNLSGLIQPHDQAILFLDLLSKSTNMPDKYASILFMEPNHPLAYYLVLEILNRLTSHRHLDAISVSMVTGSDPLVRATTYFCLVDTMNKGFRFLPGGPQKPLPPPELRDYHGRYNRTLRMVNVWEYANDNRQYSIPASLDMIRTMEYRYDTTGSNENGRQEEHDDPQRWNTTCLRRRLEYFNSML